MDDEDPVLLAIDEPNEPVTESSVGWWLAIAALVVACVVLAVLTS